MTLRSKVVWKEGLFVKPQHFQQETRYLESQLHQRLSSIGENLHGFVELELNTEYLTFGKIALLRARGAMPDGSVFDMPMDTPVPNPLDIADASAIDQVVYLALPLRIEGATEVQWASSAASRRYKAHRREIRDIHTDEGDLVEMDLAMPGYRLMLEGEDRSAFACLAITRIRDRRPDGSVVLDDAHYATALSVSAVVPLARFLEEVAGLMRQRAKVIAERIGSPSQSGVAEVTDFGLLQALNRIQPLFQHLARSRCLHPERLYCHLSQACGELVTFTDDGRLPIEYPAYQHEDLHASFHVLEETLRRVLGTVLEPRAVSIPMQLQKYGLRIAMVHDRRLIESADFILAVRANVPLEQLRARFVQQAKVASIERIDELVSLQLPGIPLVAMPVAPRHLPYHAGFTYFQLDRGSPAWQMMLSTSGIGLHVSGDFPEMDIQLWGIRSE
ncbi:type VI secretion system baseplate subunit TssK [Stenotrophomonas maltophilia]|nr:type VI secretion system baseplate subunit TssK [Stenotrophomonas maltophilia]MBA0467871.1 type VI secretion system baseplate subunit TssK [Stenotrophomonas maltophilia]MBA0477845.1 type VI secretion system baseplate subunit TssK [Stenotrophomonas maltophilia]MBA0484476.1 type VI secretion system baseplate subunit TssK [Stenotrophomonas maltophilia]